VIEDALPQGVCDGLEKCPRARNGSSCMH
jgi:hypothetical protein